MTESRSTAVVGSWQDALNKAVLALETSLIEFRRMLHSNPEPSGEEGETAARVAAALREAGLAPRQVDGCHGLLVDSPSPSSHRVALRADMDALRLHDAKQVPYRSRNDGVMHACGHDAHTAALVGAALALRSIDEQGLLPWPVAWRAIFQPAEETAVGAVQMREAGALDGVEMILALHVDPSRPVGKIGIRDGALTASCDWIRVAIEGSGGHSARPHESQDPIAAAAQFISSAYSLIPRSVDSHDPVVITFGRIEGGYSPNVIPETVEFEGTLRTLDARVREASRRRLERLARGLSEASDVEIRVEFVAGLAAVINDSVASAVVREAAGGVVGRQGVEEIDRPSMGGEDFSGYLERVPGAMFRLGVRDPDQGEHGAAPLHSPHFDIDERALAVGAEILARSVVLACRPEEA